MTPQKIKDAAHVDAFFDDQGFVNLVAEIRFSTSQSCLPKDVKELRPEMRRRLAAYIFNGSFSEVFDALKVIRQRSNFGDQELRAAVQKIEETIKI